RRERRAPVRAWPGGETQRRLPRLSEGQVEGLAARRGGGRDGEPPRLEGGRHVQRARRARRGIPPHHPARHGEEMRAQEANQGQTTFLSARAATMGKRAVRENKRGLSLFLGLVTA